MKMQPYHPMLPSIEKAHQSFSDLTSDHVPILATVPWPEGELEFDVLSWNILGSDSSNGFMQPRAAFGKYGEAPEQTIARREKIADTLVDFLTNNNPKFITLQEIDNEIAELIQKKLESAATFNKDLNYQPIKINNKIVDKGGIVTFYNANVFQPNITPATQVKDLWNDALQGLIVEFTHIPSGKIVKLANVQSDYSAVSTVHEANIYQFLTDKEEATKAVVVGDFNCHIAPLPDEQPRNIVTSATPASYRNHTRQGACAIDGCFYSDNSEKDFTHCKQAKIKHLNPLTGIVYDEKDLPVVDLSSVPAEQAEEINTYRMAISVDESYQRNKIVGFEGTIFQYEDFLQKLYDNENIVVRYATNLNNESGIAVILPKHIFDHLKIVGKDLFQFAFDENNNVTKLDSPIVYVPEKNMNIFLHLTAILPLELNLKKLKPVSEEEPLLADNLIQKFNALHQKLDEVLRDNPPIVLEKSSPYPIICEHFTKLSEELTRRSTPLSVQEIKASAKQLDEKLFGKEPMPTALKIAIGALIGALVGFVLGFVAGAAMTAWGGGFGAIPGAFIGAFEGFTAGTAIFTATAGIGMFAGGGIGYLRGNLSNNIYNEQKANKVAEIDAEVMTACKNILTP